MFPTRLTVVTYNLWNTERWDVRRPALGQFVRIYNPDIMCVQELREETRDFLDQAMPRHRRVHDDLSGWTREGNIFWNADLLTEVTHGAEDVGMIGQYRRLFWARLQLNHSDRTVLIGTAHFTYQRHPQECETGHNPRMEQTRKTIEALEGIAHDGEPVLFMGDLNDNIHPPRLLHEAGYVGCFAALGLLPPTTWPCYPTANVAAGDRVANQTLDWMVANQFARPVAAHVPQCYCGDVAPSDHWPILAVYEV
jgi:endonuclease/exonuclease/phosphatase family metal-dependent hydrolase